MGFRPKKSVWLSDLRDGDIFAEDCLLYQDESEWVEIDSDEITYFIADHQDQFDTLEITDK